MTCFKNSNEAKHFIFVHCTSNPFFKLYVDEHEDSMTLDSMMLLGSAENKEIYLLTK